MVFQKFFFFAALSGLFLGSPVMTEVASAQPPPFSARATLTYDAATKTVTALGLSRTVNKAFNAEWSINGGLATPDNGVTDGNGGFRSSKAFPNAQPGDVVTYKFWWPNFPQFPLTRTFTIPPPSPQPSATKGSAAMRNKF